MNRKTEFLATIKPILEKQEAKKDAIKLAQELGNLLSEINVDADGGGLTELKEVFNAQLAEMGKQPIVFSESTLKGITAQFANAVSEGIKAGTASVDSEIAELTKQRTSLLTERDALNKQIKHKTLKEELSKFDSSTAKPLKVSGDLEQEALRIKTEYLKAYYDLQEFSDDKGNTNTTLEGYEEAVLNAQQKAIQLIRMHKTLVASKDTSLDKLRQWYTGEIEGTTKYKSTTDHIDELFEPLNDVFVEQSERLDDIQAALQNVNVKIEELQNKKIDIISDDDKADISSTLKSLEEIEAAHKRISTQKGALRTTPAKELNAALYPEQEFKSLLQLSNEYNSAYESGANWEKLYTSAVRFVNKFEADLKSGQISKNGLPEFTQLYDKLAPIVNDARESLRLLAEFQPVKKQSKTKQTAEEDANVVALHENNELLKQLVGDREKSVFYDSKTGKYSRVRAGDNHQIETSLSDIMKASKDFDTAIHSHTYNVAAPSIFGEGNDMDTWLRSIEYIKKRAIVARNEVLSFDFSSLKDGDLQNIITQYREAATIVQKEFDDIIANRQVGDKFGTLKNLEEAFQARLREELEKIMAQFPGVMFSSTITSGTHDMPSEEKTNARRKELTQQLDKYGEDVLDSKTADDNLEIRKEILELLQKEGLLTDDIKKHYDEVNQRLETRANLIREAESHYDDPDDILTGQRVTSVDSADQFRKDHIQPFDNVIAKMHDSGFFSEEELENSFEAISRSMEQRARDIAAKGVFDKLDKNIIDPDAIEDAEWLNKILQERNTILNSVDEMSLIDYDHNAYADALKHNQLIEDRIAMLQKAQSLLPNADNFNHNSFMDEAQKAEVLKLGEEYRTIMTLLERDDAEVSEIAGALRERATAIMNVMHAVKGSDSTPAESYQMYFGGSTETAKSLANWQLADGLYISSFNSDKIDNTARQVAIDLIYKEIEAQKQLAEARKAAREAERQQDIDNFVSKYENATAEEKQLVNDLTGLWRESHRLNDLEDDESVRAYNQVIAERLEVSEKLKAANRELYEAFYDISLKDAAEHIKPIDAEHVGGASSAEVDDLRQQLEEANKRAEEAESSAKSERIKREMAEEAYDDLHDDLYDARNQIRVAEDEAERLREELSKKHTGVPSGTGDTDTGTESSRMTSLKEAVEAVTEAVGLKTGAFQTEKTEVDKVVDAEVESLGKLESKITTIKGIFEGLVNNIRNGNDDIGAGLNNVNINVNYPENDSAVEISSESIDKLVATINNFHPKVTDVGNALATENTLSAIKKAVESINSKTIKGTKVGPGSNRKSTTADDYKGSPFFGEKLNTREMELAKFVQKLMNEGQDTPKMQDAVKQLRDALKLVNSGEKLSVWDQKFRQAKLAVGIDELKEKPDEQESVQTYKNLIAYAKEYYSIVEKYEKAKEGTRRKAILAQQKQDAETFMRDGGLNLDTIELGDEAYNKKLSDLRAKHKRNLEVIKADNQDKVNAQEIKATSDAQKQEADIVKKLIALYKELGNAKARQNSDLFDENQVAKAYVDEARIRRQIKEQRSSLGTISQDAGLQFKLAKDEAYTSTTTDAKLVADSKVRKQQVKDETDALNTLLSLYKKYGALDAKWNYANGSAEAVEQERQMMDVYKQIQEQKASMGLSESSTKYDDQITKAWEQGFKDVENAKREARAKASDKDEVRRIQDEVKNVEKYVKELGALEAELQFTSGAKEINEINRQIEQKKRYINIKKQELDLDERSLLIQQTKSYQDKYNSLSLKDRRAKDKADDAAITQRNNEAYERLIKLRREQYDIEKKLYAVEKGSKLEATYKSQLTDIGHLIANQKMLVHYNAKYERQLTEMANAHKRNKEQWESGKIDDARAEALAKEKEEVKKLTKAYEMLGKLVAERNYATLPEEKDAIQATINKHVKDINANPYNTANRFNMLRGVAKDAQAKAEEGLSRKAAKKVGTDRLRNEAKVENEELAKQKQIVSNLISLYKQLGQAKARQNTNLFSDEQVAQAYVEDAQIRRLIKAERAKLSSVDLDTDMKFKGAKAEGYRITTTNAERTAAGKATSQRVREETKAENDALREQKQIIKELNDLYKQLGQAEAKRDMTAQNSAQVAKAKEEYDDIEKEINAKRQLIKIDDELENQFTDSWMSGIEAETKSPIGNLTKAYEKLGELRAKIEQTPAGDYLDFLKRQLVLKSKLLVVESDRLGISQHEKESNRLKAEDVYNSEMFKWQGELAKKKDKERNDEQAKLFKQQIKQSKELAKVNQATSAINKADSTLNLVPSIGGWSGEHVARLNEYSDKLRALKDQYTEIKYSDGVVTADQQEELINQTLNVNKLTEEINELIANYNRLSGENTTVLGADTLGSNATIGDYKKQLTDLVMAHTNGKASITGFDAATKELTYTVQTGKYEFTEYTVALRQADGQIVKLEGNTKRLETPMEKLKRKMSEILTYFVGSSLIYEFFGQFRQGVQYVRDIDSALTELKKVTDETEETYDRFLETAAKTADKVGSTITNIVSSTADWARLNI